MGKPSRINRTFGYHIDGSINEAEAYYVREVFRRFASGSSGAVITRWLNAEGINHTANHSLWYRAAIRYMLTNRRYLGEIYYLGQLTAKGQAAIIDSVQFEIVQQRIAHDKALRKHYLNRKRYLGANLYLCGLCGKRVHSTSKKPPKGQTERPHGYGCDGCVYLSGAPVDIIVEAFMVDHLRSDKVRAQYATDEHSGKALALKAEGQALEVDRAGYMNMLSLKQIDGAEYAVLVAPIKERLLTITRERAEIARESALAEILGAADPGVAWLDHPDIHVRSKVLDELIRVRLYPVGKGKRFRSDRVVIEPRNATP